VIKGFSSYLVFKSWLVGEGYPWINRSKGAPQDVTPEGDFYAVGIRCDLGVIKYMEELKLVHER